MRRLMDLKVTSVAAAALLMGTSCSAQDNAQKADSQVPFAPLITAADVRDGTVTLTFEPPVDDGGAKIVTHIATCKARNEIRTAAAGEGFAVLRSMTSGKTYTCTVAAMNAVGVGPASNPVQVTSAKTTAQTVRIAGSFQ